ncbi:MAG: zf-HC2 domain-containing protein [Planctomycetes bacterium]|nr:zf-HC2 domain-containing protein [Planctomycetota bacterium]
MNCRELENNLAEYLAGELSPADHASARQHVQACPTCAARVVELQTAAAVLESGDVSAADADRATAGLPLPARPQSAPILLSRARMAHSVFRYAAVILIAFGAGYWMRGTAPPKNPPSLTPTQQAPSATPTLIVARYEAASQAYPNAPSLSRTLLAFANAAPVGSSRH